MTPPTGPMAPGSISLRLYPHQLPPHERLLELEHQACLATDGGLDGVLVSEDLAEIAGALLAAAEATAADALDLRVHVAGIAPELAREQIGVVVADILPTLRQRFRPASTPGPGPGSGAEAPRERDR